MSKNEKTNEQITPKEQIEISGKTVVTHDDFLALEIQKAVDVRLKSLTLNEIRLGCTVLDKKTRKGKPKKDANGNETGDFWADTFEVEVSFEGGKFPVRIDEATYLSLDVGCRYLATGLMESKQNDYGFNMASAKIFSFQKLF